MQLKALTAIVSIALTVGVHAVPNPVDRAAGVNDVLKRSHSNGIDISKRQEWLNAFNTVRAHSGAPPVTWNGRLAAIAKDGMDLCKFETTGLVWLEVVSLDTSGLGLTPWKAVESWMGGYSLATSPQ
jgi:hypothetical protein